MENTNLPANSALYSGSVTDSFDKVERIRDLLFGPQMRDYTQRIAALNRDLATLSQATARLSEIIQEQESKFAHLLRQETERIATQLQEQGKRAQEHLQQVDERLTEEWKALEQSHSQHINAVAHSIDYTEQTLRAELHELAQGLNHQKVDRSTLSDLLINLGQSLKSTAPTPLPMAVDLLDQLSQELA